jgi:hypothetical protein
MNEIIFQIDEAPEGGYTAKALGHAIFTEADTLDAHFDEGQGPRLIRLHFVHDEVLAA